MLGQVLIDTSKLIGHYIVETDARTSEEVKQEQLKEIEHQWQMTWQWTEPIY